MRRIPTSGSIPECFLSPKPEALDLAGCSLRKFLPNLDPAGIFPVADALFDMVLQGRDIDACGGVHGNDKGFRFLQPLFIQFIRERIRAIATMLSQNPPSDSAIENAKELLANAYESYSKINIAH